MDTVALGEALGQVAFVLPDAQGEVGGATHLQSTVSSAREGGRRKDATLGSGLRRNDDDDAEGSSPLSNSGMTHVSPGRINDRDRNGLHILKDLANW